MGQKIAEKEKKKEKNPRHPLFLVEDGANLHSYLSDFVNQYSRLGWKPNWVSTDERWDRFNNLSQRSMVDIKTVWRNCRFKEGGWKPTFQSFKNLEKILKNPNKYRWPSWHNLCQDLIIIGGAHCIIPRTYSHESGISWVLSWSFEKMTDLNGWVSYILAEWLELIVAIDWNRVRTSLRAGSIVPKWIFQEVECLEDGEKMSHDQIWNESLCKRSCSHSLASLSLIPCQPCIEEKKIGELVVPNMGVDLCI